MPPTVSAARSAKVDRWNVSVFEDGAVVPDPDWTAPGSSMLVGVGTWVSWSRRAVMRYFGAMSVLNGVTTAVLIAGFVWQIGFEIVVATACAVAICGPIQVALCINAFHRTRGTGGAATMAPIWLRDGPEGVDEIVRAAAASATLSVLAVKDKAFGVNYEILGGVRVSARNLKPGRRPIMTVRTRGEAGLAAHTRLKGALMEQAAERRPDWKVAQVAE